MVAKVKVLNNREEWLRARGKSIGGSDAAAIIGRNPYKSNVDLWREKTGQVEVEDISDKPDVKYGIEAEHHLRELFKLDYPEYKVFYTENNLWMNDQYPWGHYSADGWLEDKDGRRGILEIKTTSILQSMQREKWKDRIPDNYYVQIIHGFLITESDFAIVKAQLKSEFRGEIYLQTKHYYINRAEVLDDIEILAHREKIFWQYMKEGVKPSLILPQI